MPILDFKSKDVDKIVRKITKKYGVNIGIIIGDVLNGDTALVSGVNIDKLGEATLEVIEDPATIEASGVSEIEFGAFILEALPEIAFVVGSGVVVTEATQILEDPFADPFASEEHVETRAQRRRRKKREEEGGDIESQGVPDLTYKWRAPEIRWRGKPTTQEIPGFQEVDLADEPVEKIEARNNQNDPSSDVLAKGSAIAAAISAAILGLGGSREFFHIKLINLKTVRDDSAAGNVVEWVSICRKLTVYLHFVIALPPPDNFDVRYAADFSVGHFMFALAAMGFLGKRPETRTDVEASMSNAYLISIRDTLFSVLPAVPESDLVKTTVGLFNVFADNFNNTPREEEMERTLLAYLRIIRSDIVSKVKIYEKVIGESILDSDVEPDRVTRVGVEPITGNGDEMADPDNENIDLDEDMGNANQGSSSTGSTQQSSSAKEKSGFWGGYVSPWFSDPDAPTSTQEHEGPKKKKQKMEKTTLIYAAIGVAAIATTGVIILKK